MRKVLTGPESNFLASIHINNINIPDRELFLFGQEQAALSDEDPGIEFVMANEFIRNIRLLDSISHDPILVHMKSDGGFIEEGMAMYDAITMARSNVTMLVYKHATSMAAIVLQAANWRVLMPHSWMMIHYGSIGASGDVKAVLSSIAWDKKVMVDSMTDICAERMINSSQGRYYGKKKKEAFKWLDDKMSSVGDVYLDAKQTIDIGLADAVFDGDWEALVDYSQ